MHIRGFLIIIVDHLSFAPSAHLYYFMVLFLSIGRFHVLIPLTDRTTDCLAVLHLNHTITVQSLKCTYCTESVCFLSYVLTSLYVFSL